MGEVQPDGTIHVRDVPLFSEVRDDDAAAQDGTRKVRDRSWLETALQKHRERLALGHKPLMTLRHQHEDPRAVGWYLLERIEDAEVNPGDVRATLFGTKVYRDRLAFEEARDYLARSVELSPDYPEEIGALALLRDREPFFKYPGLVEKLPEASRAAFVVEAYRSRLGDAPQVWKGQTEMFSATSETPHSVAASLLEKGRISREAFDEIVTAIESFGSADQPRADDGKWGGGGGSSKAADMREKAAAIRADTAKKNADAAKEIADLKSKTAAAKATNAGLADKAKDLKAAIKSTNADTKRIVADSERDDDYEAAEATKEGSMPADTEEKKAPSIDERMEAMASKFFESLAKKFDAYLAASKGDADKAKSDSKESDRKSKEDDTAKESTAKAGGTEEPSGKKPESAEASRAPDPVPAVSQARPGESFAAKGETFTKDEKLELLGLRSWAKEQQQKERVESFAAAGEKALSDAGVAVDAETRSEIRKAAVELGEQGVKHVVGTIARYAKSAARMPEAYGALATGVNGGPAPTAFDADVKKAVETFGQRPEVKARILDLAAGFRAEGETFVRSLGEGEFFKTCQGTPSINPSIMEARGGLRRGV